MGAAITLGDGNGHGGQTIGAYLAVPRSGGGPGVVVLHAWWGLNDFFKRLCDRLAAEGFVALAPDFYGGAVATTIEAAQQLVDSIGAAEGARVSDAAIDCLLHHNAVTSASVSIISFSMGVYYGLQAATTRPDDIAAVVLYYGTSDHEFSAASSAFLGHFAQDDPYEDAEWVATLEERMRTSGNPVTFHTYPGTGHWFAEDDRPDAFDPAAAALAWERTLTFLREPRACE